jgi:IS5 family transposase
MTRSTRGQISFADVEFLAQGVCLEPILQAVSNFIDQHGHLIEKVRRDLERGLKNPKTGRNGLTAQQVIRSLTLMRVKNWDYRELRERINDGVYLAAIHAFLQRSCSQT